MTVQVKICGLSEPDTLRTAARAGSDWIGFVFFEKSPRHVTLAAAESLLLSVGSAIPVALLVDPSDAFVREAGRVGFQILQLHGQETPERVSQIKQLSGAREVWKAAGIASEADLASLEAYVGHADRLLLDYKPPEMSDIPGGAGHAFDWSLLKNWAAPLPWILAGGLTPENIAEAITATGARAVDVSSGVERKRGLKDAEKIQKFIDAAKQP